MKKFKPHLISLIMPAYKQEKSIRKDLLRIIAILDQLRYAYEIIVVVDGQVDKTYENAKKVVSRNLSILTYPKNFGKGYAIRFGMSKARGDIIGFIDSGMDINPNGLSMLLEHFEWYNADIIVGSKLHPASKVKYPLPRKVLSIGYRLLVKLLFGLRVRDTQVGIKLFRREVIKDLLPLLLVKKYAFDIEILAVANYFHYKRIYEAPVEVNFNTMSSITSKNFWRVVLLMIWDTLAVFYRLKLLHYYDKRRTRKGNKQ